MNGLLNNIPKNGIIGLLPPITSSTYNFLVCALENGLSVAPFPQLKVKYIEEWKMISSKARISTILGINDQYDHLKALSNTFGIPGNVILSSEILPLVRYEDLLKAGQFYISNLVKLNQCASDVTNIRGKILYYDNNRNFISIDGALLKSFEGYVTNSVLKQCKITKDDTVICCSNSHLSYVLMLLLNKLTRCRLCFTNDYLLNMDSIQDNIQIKSKGVYKIWDLIRESYGNVTILLNDSHLDELEKTYNDNFSESANKISCILNIDRLSFEDGQNSNIFSNAKMPSILEFPLFDRESITAGPFKSPFIRKRDLMKSRPEGYVKRVPIQGKRWGNFTGRNRNWTLLFK